MGNLNRQRLGQDIGRVFKMGIVFLRKFDRRRLVQDVGRVLNMGVVFFLRGNWNCRRLAQDIVKHTIFY